MLAAAMDISQIQFRPWVLIPGFMIFLCVMAFNYLGDGLRDAFDPRGIQLPPKEKKKKKKKI
jgi:peptide/nickel transport system permease protein